MLFVFLLILWSTTVCIPGSFALAAAPEELFQKGVEAYATKKYAEARELFNQVLTQDPHNATVLTNLALTEFHLDKKPLAAGLLRKALFLQPELKTAQESLKFILAQLPAKSRNSEAYESVRAILLQPVPVLAYLVLSALTFFASGWILISFLGHRKRAFEEQTAPPPIPWIGSVLSLLFMISTGLLILKFYDQTILRGTIIDDSVSLQTAPGDNQVTILELQGGFEVIARQSQGDWVQVTYPGSLTGWIKKSSILMTR